MYCNFLTVLKLQFRSAGEFDAGFFIGLHNKAGAIQTLFGVSAVFIVGPHIIADGIPEALVRRHCRRLFQTGLGDCRWCFRVLAGTP